MNKTNTPTVDKKVFPLRLPPDIYKKVRAKVQMKKDEGDYAYSINDFLTQVIEDSLKGEDNG